MVTATGVPRDPKLERLLDRDDVAGLPAGHARHLHARRGLGRRFHTERVSRRFRADPASKAVRMIDDATDFGTGLRAHLGLERAQLDLVAEPTMPPHPAAATADDPAPDAAVVAQHGRAAALEAELVEREHALSMRERTLAGRAGAVLAAAQALYDEVLGGDAFRPRTTSSPACGGGRAWPDGLMLAAARARGPTAALERVRGRARRLVRDRAGQPVPAARAAAGDACAPDGDALRHRRADDPVEENDPDFDFD